MFVTLLGGILGGLSRLAPELLKFWDRKAERQHELDMLDRNTAADKLRMDGQLAQTNTMAQQAEFSSALQALTEAVKAQATQTGIKFVDAINSFVRPSVTYILFGMWTMIKVVTLTYVIKTTPDFQSFIGSLGDWWKPEDQGMLAAILNFWFMGRVFDIAARGK